MYAGNKTPSVAHGAELHTNAARELFLFPHSEVGTGLMDRAYIGHHAAMRLQDGYANAVFWEFKVPADFVSLSSLVVLVVSAATGTLYWDVYADFGANGEDYDNHVSYTTGTETLVTVDKLTELADVSSVLSGLAKGDYVGIYFRRRADDVKDTIGTYLYVLGLIISYVGER